jgi:hypothetical protein
MSFLRELGHDCQTAAFSRQLTVMPKFLPFLFIVSVEVEQVLAAVGYFLCRRPMGLALYLARWVVFAYSSLKNFIVKKCESISII